jgi:hypothetical protein
VASTDVANVHAAVAKVGQTLSSLSVVGADPRAYSAKKTSANIQAGFRRIETTRNQLNAVPIK